MTFRGNGIVRAEGTRRLRRRFLWLPQTLQGVCRWLEWADYWERSRVEFYEHSIGGNESETCQRTLWEATHWHVVRIQGDESN